MSIKNIIEEISAESGMKIGKVRAISKLLLEKIVQTLDSNEPVRGIGVVFKPVKSDDPNKIGILRKFTPKEKGEESGEESSEETGQESEDTN